ncbi:MAG: hypothetical protein R2741_07225 [Methanolobus sp.]
MKPSQKRQIEKLERLRINKIKNSTYKQVRREKEIQIKDNEISV